MFLAAEAKNDAAPSTLKRRLSAIRLMHLGARVVSPHNAVEIQEVMRGIRRLSTRGVVKKEAAVDEQIKKMVDTCECGDLPRATGSRASLIWVRRGLAAFGVGRARCRAFQTERCGICRDDCQIEDRSRRRRPEDRDPPRDRLALLPGVGG